METTTPNTPQELMEMNSTPPTLEEMMEMFVKMGYEDKDNFIFHLLQWMRNFYGSCGGKELERDEPNPKFVEKCWRNKVTLDNIISLYQEV